MAPPPRLIALSISLRINSNPKINASLPIFFESFIAFVPEVWNFLKVL